MTFYKEHKIYSYPPRGSNGCIGPAYASCCYHKIVWIYEHELGKYRKKRWNNKEIFIENKYATLRVLRLLPPLKLVAMI